MPKAVLNLGLLLALVAACAATPAYVQGICGGHGSTAPVALTMPSSVAAGDELIVYFEADSTSTTISVSDSLNGIFTVGATHVFSSGSVGTAAVAYFENSISGSDTVTVSATGTMGKPISG